MIEIEAYTSTLCIPGLRHNMRDLAGCRIGLDQARVLPQMVTAAYPDVCIPSPPPDLDSGEIVYRNFTVLAPDPHRFDGDKDGVGCER